MTNYRDQPFNKRLSTMGDISEQMFEAIAPLGKWERFGWNRPSLTMTHMSEFIRHKPDYYTQIGYLVECAGLGRDGVYKLKLTKYEALKAWNKHQEVRLFLWNSSMSEWVLLSWDQVKSLVGKARKAGVKAFENDGNEYYAIQWSWIEGALPYE